jgi:hypothetical protein
MVQQRPKSIGRVDNVIFITGQHIDPQHQAQAREHVGVIGVRRTPGLVRIVADLSPLLMAVDSLHRAVHVEHPWLAQQRRGAVVQMVLQPGQACGCANRRQAAAHRVLADNLAHAEQRRVHRITAQRSDVRVAPMSGQHGQHHSAEQVALGGGIRAGQR